VRTIPPSETRLSRSRSRAPNPLSRLERWQSAKGTVDLVPHAPPPAAGEVPLATLWEQAGAADREGRHADAAHLCRAIIARAPAHAEALHLLGTLHFRAGEPGTAADLLRRALAVSPGELRYHADLASVLRAAGDTDAATAVLRRALRLDPDRAELHTSLGTLLRSRGEHDEAARAFRRAIALDPHNAIAHHHLGATLKDKGNIPEALVAFRRSLEIEPRSTDTLDNLAIALHDAGETHEAVTTFERALALNPDDVAARWGRCISMLPVLYDSADELSRCRSRYAAALEELAAGLRLDTPQRIASAARAVGSLQPFYLAYQGGNDRELQRVYGELVCRIQAARYPALATPPPMPARGGSARLRVGIVSGFFWLHSNWKIPIKGWVDHLDRDRFELYGYHTRRKVDSQTRAAQQAFDVFVNDLFDVVDLARRIREDALHVLIFPEVGMDPLTVRLASLRLAPVQASSWGHPITSGLPTVDYYLSSDLMEPEDGDDFYTERLVRLPNLSIHYTPLKSLEKPIDRTEIGVRDGAVAFLCCQSMYKYLPRFDDVFPRIARRVGDCQFVFIGNPRMREVAERFRLRIGRAFEAAGLDPDEHVVILDYMAPARYQMLHAACDVFLDSIGWSGCNSTLEALGHHLPVVTLAGDSMRARHSYAILRMMGITETIAPDLDGYVRLAVELALDPERRAALGARIAERKQRAYRDLECVRGLEAFLERAVEEHAAPASGDARGPAPERTVVRPARQAARIPDHGPLNVNDELRCIFVHIPKAAGSSIKQALALPGNGHLPWYYYAQHYADRWARYLTFAVVRNPWDRVVSAYHYAIMPSSYWHNTRLGPHPDFATLEHRSFAECCRMLVEERDPLVHESWIPQHRWIVDQAAGAGTQARGEIAVDMVLRQERLEEDFAGLARRLGLEAVELPRVNTSERASDYRSCYDAETRALVARAYERDIELFGYSF